MMLRWEKVQIMPKEWFVARSKIISICTESDAGVIHNIVTEFK